MSNNFDCALQTLGVLSVQCSGVQSSGKMKTIRRDSSCRFSREFDNSGRPVPAKGEAFYGVEQGFPSVCPFGYTFLPHCGAEESMDSTLKSGGKRGQDVHGCRGPGGLSLEKYLPDSEHRWRT